MDGAHGFIDVEEKLEGAIWKEESGEWSGRRDSNPRPSAPKADALPDCATPRRLHLIVSRDGIHPNEAWNPQLI